MSLIFLDFSFGHYERYEVETSHFTIRSYYIAFDEYFQNQLLWLETDRSSTRNQAIERPHKTVFAIEIYNLSTTTMNKFNSYTRKEFSVDDVFELLGHSCDDGARPMDTCGHFCAFTLSIHANEIHIHIYKIRRLHVEALEYVSSKYCPIWKTCRLFMRCHRTNGSRMLFFF